MAVESERRMHGEEEEGRQIQSGEDDHRRDELQREKWRKGKFQFDPSDMFTPVEGREEESADFKTLSCLQALLR